MLGDRVVDVPRRDQLYADYPETWREQRYGRGFTLYGLLEDIPLDRTSTWERLGDGEYDLVVIGDIWRCWGTYVQLLGFADRASGSPWSTAPTRRRRTLRGPVVAATAARGCCRAPTLACRTSSVS